MKGGGGEEQEIPGVRVGGREKYYLVFYMDSRARPGKEGCCLLGMHGQIHPSRYTSSCWEINCSFPWDLSEPVQHLLFLHQTHIHLPTFLRGSITCRGVGGVCLPGRLCTSRLRLVFLKHRESWKWVVGAPRIPPLPYPLLSMYLIRALSLL